MPYNNSAHWKDEEMTPAGCGKSSRREERERAEMAERLKETRVRGGDSRRRDDKDCREEEGGTVRREDEVRVVGKRRERVT